MFQSLALTFDDGSICRFVNYPLPVPVRQYSPMWDDEPEAD